MENNKMSRKNFVETILSDVISIASGRGSRGWVDNLEFDEESEIVIIVCENGHTYHVNVAGDSHSAIIEDVIRVVLRHS